MSSYVRAARLLGALEHAGLTCWTEAGLVRWRGPAGVLGAGAREELRACKAEAVALLGVRQRVQAIWAGELGPACSACGRVQTWDGAGLPVCPACSPHAARWSGGIPGGSAPMGLLGCAEVLTHEARLLALGWQAGELWSVVGWYGVHGLVVCTGGSQIVDIDERRVMLAHQVGAGRVVHQAFYRRPAVGTVPACWLARAVNQAQESVDPGTETSERAA